MKSKRQSKVLEIIDRYSIENQEELGIKLKESNFTVTQATISRDIKELRLIKVLNSNGKYQYAPFRDKNDTTNERIVNVFRESVVNVDYSGNIIIIKTLAGTAMAASAAIDSMEWPDVMGCVSGDDTIFVLVRDMENIESIVNKYKKLMR
ncbi:arginine repressor [Alkalibaculum sp. M08DMB]|uniref:Arginine repressor n=1 Tax=Alkalibaculum sporogenes TaxID=2655001 RepID=A0A6A7K6V9_9FIRM|nr:arginine repressor [Alkalibaculum sporogenes]MPW25166.1 arginine repressor [Alkalibaculum sporogenes]